MHIIYASMETTEGFNVHDDNNVNNSSLYQSMHIIYAFMETTEGFNVHDDNNVNNSSLS